MEINYDKIAFCIIGRIEAEEKKGNHANRERITVLCAMLDYMLESEKINARVGRHEDMHPAWKTLLRFYPYDGPEGRPFGILSDDLLDFMIFD